jgi:NAD(P)-dependent dehydrogenase (short-subunit alcohol dehydrogenase family)
MAGRLEDKVIILAGGGGIGSGLARAFVAEGAKVVLGDLDEAAATETARALDPSGERIVATHLDGADEASIAALVQLALSRHGRLNGFHANYACFADAHLKGGVVDLPMEAYDETMAVNTRGFVLCTKAAVPAMIESGGGAMVYTSSVDAYAGAAVRVAYAMSKAALHALMRHTARRYGPKGIRANIIAPGLIVHEQQLTRMSPEASKALQEDVLRRQPTPRWGAPADIAAMAVLLLSDEGGYITGQAINVDGGLVMRP